MDFTEGTKTALKKKSKATKCSDHHTHTANTVVRIFRLKGKSKMYWKKISLDFEEEKDLGMQLGSSE